MAGLPISCSKPPKAEWKIVEISEIPDPLRTPYPSAAAVLLCENGQQEPCLIAIPAYRDRKILKSFEQLKPGSLITTELIPWAERPANVLAMYVANDFVDHFDLALFFTNPDQK